MFRKTAIMTILILSSLFSVTMASTPTLINYQGLLTDAFGMPVTDDTYPVTFKIYDDSVGGSVKWWEGKTITTSNGLFSTMLGSVYPLNHFVFANVPRYLGITLSGDPEISPRTRFTSVPYAFRVSSVDSATGGVIVGGLVIQPTFQRDTGDAITLLSGTGEVSTSINVKSAGGTRIDLYDPVDSKDRAITKKLSLSTNGITIFGSSILDTTIRISDSGDIFLSGEIRLDTNVSNANMHVVGRGQFVNIIKSEYVGPVINFDYLAVHGRSVPRDWYGIGGSFVGGYRGVQGSSYPTGAESYTGVYGSAIGGSGTNYGVYGFASTGATNWAGYFAGDVRVTGAIDNSKSMTVIDHPLDPANKYLYHSSVISPEMKNVYDGVVILDSDGQAIVNLPDYFDKLNENCRYQLTCIGGYAPIYIADEISNNQFRIAGGQPGMKVSWQVTGVRSDSFAKANPMQVEKLKVSKERGKYLNPKAFGLGVESGIDYEMQDTSERKADRQQ